MPRSARKRAARRDVKARPRSRSTSRTRQSRTRKASVSGSRKKGSRSSLRIKARSSRRSRSLIIRPRSQSPERPGRRSNRSRSFSRGARSASRSRTCDGRSRSRSPRPRSRSARSDVSKTPASQRRSRSRTRRAVKLSKRMRSRSPPRYDVMVKQAIQSLDEDRGSCRSSIMKYIMDVFKPCETPATVDRHVRVALREGAKKGMFRQRMGPRSTGYFSLGLEPGNVKEPGASSSDPKRSSRSKKVAETPQSLKEDGVVEQGEGTDPGNSVLDLWIWSPEDEELEAVN